MWKDICVIEKDLIEKKSGDYKGYVMIASSFVVTLLTLALINDHNDSDISEAAAMYLKMVSQIVKDSNIGEIVPFVQKHISRNALKEMNTLRSRWQRQYLFCESLMHLLSLH